jgi:MFS family permease
MLSFLAIVPLASILSALWIYRRTGRRDFLKFDAVQFIYAFILAPLLFVWLKSFLFYLLRQEIDIRLNSTEMFIIDTAFSVVSLYVYAFIVIHSLTKSFELKRYSDPLYDVFTHSEALHLWISHTAMYTGGMTIFTLLSMVNVLAPAQVETTQVFFYLMLILGFLAGTFGFAGIWLSNFTDSPVFLKIMKIFVALYFSLHVGVYFILSPAFNASNIVYWMIFMAYFAMAGCSFLFERSERASGWFDRFHHKNGWKKGNFLVSKSGFKL